MSVCETRTKGGELTSWFTFLLHDFRGEPKGILTSICFL
jgi:hypothetical protein